MVLIAWASSNGSNAKIFCDINNKQDYEEDLCDGYTAAVFFYLVAAVISAVAAFLTFKSLMQQFHALVYYLAFSIFYLGFTCAMGGVSASQCELNENHKLKGLAKEQKNYFVRLGPLFVCCLLIGTMALAHTTSMGA